MELAYRRRFVHNGSVHPAAGRPDATADARHRRREIGEPDRKYGKGAEHSCPSAFENEPSKTTVIKRIIGIIAWTATAVLLLTAHGASATEKTKPHTVL